MLSGLARTFSLLKETANEAAVPVLVAALDSSDLAIQEEAVQAILGRRKGAGQRVLIERWPQLPERWKLHIARHPRQISSAVRSAILGTEPELCVSGCDALLYLRDYELIPTLVAGVERPNQPQLALVGHTLLSLCEILEEELSGPRDMGRHNETALFVAAALPSLERAVERFELHRCRDAVESFLLLASSDNTTLQRLLADPRHPAYLVVLDVLCKSLRMPIIRLVLNLLEVPQAPSAVIQVVAHRTDTTFLRSLLKRIGYELSDTLRAHLKRVESLPCLTQSLAVLDTLAEKDEVAAVLLATGSNLNRIEAFRVVQYLMTRGRTEARRLASRALAEFGGAEANQLALHGLRDPDPQVQANVTLQLRDRGIPGAITQLIRLLDSPHQDVRLAAQESLTEFNFNRYITMFDLMDEKIRASTGLLVMRVDPKAATELAGELKSRTRTRRLRGLEAAVAMDAVDQVEPMVIDLLSDTDHFVRAEAARTLGCCNTPLAYQALQTVLHDRSAAVRESAEQALNKLTAEGRMTAALSITSALDGVESSPLLTSPSDTPVS